jgi:transposase InsO family protein
MDGLRAASKRPKSSPTAKVADKHRDWIRDLRKRGLGSRRIQNELKRVYNFEISRATIDKTLRALEAKPLLRRPRNRKHSTRYAKLIPGERVQMDTCKIAPGVYQCTAIDDCTRIRVLAIYPRRSAANSLRFLERQSKNFPFQFRRFRQIVAESSSPIRSRKDYGVCHQIPPCQAGLTAFEQQG